MWSDLIEKISWELAADLPLPKVFKPKMGLPKLMSYGPDLLPDAEYWSYWPTNYDRVGRSRIDGHRLKELALEVGFWDHDILERAFSDLTNGAKIGCQGVY